MDSVDEWAISGLEPLISDGLAPSGVTHIDQDPSIISRIAHSPRVGSVSHDLPARQEDHCAMGNALLVVMDGAMR